MVVRQYEISSVENLDYRDFIATVTSFRKLVAAVLYHLGSDLAVETAQIYDYRKGEYRDLLSSRYEEDVIIRNKLLGKVRKMARTKILRLRKEEVA